MNALWTTSVKALAIAGLVAAASACSSSFKIENYGPGGSYAVAAPSLEAQANAIADWFREYDPSLERFFEEAHAYVVFPEITKGAVGVGGAGGEGVVYEAGQPVGYAEMRQATIGAQIGGQRYAELIFFRDELSFDRFKRGEFEFSAQTSAVAASRGGATNADYEDGVAIFTGHQSGLMAEASVGGQRFWYWPKKDVDSESAAATDADANLAEERVNIDRQPAEVETYRERETIERKTTDGDVTEREIIDDSLPE